MIKIPLQKAALNAVMAKSEVLQLDWREKEAALYVKGTAKEFARSFQAASTAPASGGSRTALAGWSRWLIGQAEAQEVMRPSLDEVIAGLRSDDVVVRRAARDLLSGFGVDKVPAIMTVLSRDYADYRVRLGVSVAVTQMLRQDAAKASQIGRLLRPQDVDILLKGAGDPDRTVRVYATEFLYDLADPEVAKKAIKLASETSDDNARYNWLLASQGGWTKLPPDEKAALKTSLESASAQSGPRTKELLGKLQN